MRTTDYLDAAKTKLALPSDYALAKELELTHQALSKMRDGTVMSNTTAAKIAEILEIEPIIVIAECELERNGSIDVWQRMAVHFAKTIERTARKYGVKVLAGAAIAIGASSAPPPASAAPSSAQTVQPLCIMSTRRRRSLGFALQAFVARLAGLAL